MPHKVIWTKYAARARRVEKRENTSHIQDYFRRSEAVDTSGAIVDGSWNAAAC
jgi:hypothetical protein